MFYWYFVSADVKSLIFLKFYLFVAVALSFFQIRNVSVPLAGNRPHVLTLDENSVKVTFRNIRKKIFTHKISRTWTMPREMACLQKLSHKLFALNTQNISIFRYNTLRGQNIQYNRSKVPKRMFYSAWKQFA